MDLSHLEVMYKNQEIMSKIEKYASKINKKYKGKNLILVGCLNGAFMFFTELAKKVEIKCLIDFIGLSSYAKNKQLEKIEKTKLLKYDIKDYNVVLVDDICDTGRSLSTAYEYLMSQGASNIDIVTLIGHKNTKYPLINEKIEYFWEYKENSFYVGFGFDDHEHYRQLTDIYRVKK